MKARVNLDESTTGANRIKKIRKTVFEELVNMLRPERTAFKPKRGKSNVFMFVGLQGSGKTTTIAKFANYWKRKGVEGRHGVCRYLPSRSLRPVEAKRNQN